MILAPPISGEKAYVGRNLLSILRAAGQEVALYFWAVQGRHEVDFTIEAGRFPIASKLKSPARWQKKDLAGLNAFLTAPRGRKFR
ncbi:MAG: hypothetical protein SWQ30_18445 [Thermodesulfobacteriota bacterium]|nr:hypothetical protein [Thermodesulfobacteriota bacterium]